MSESPAECLKKTYVKLRYIPPPNPQEAADCSQVQLLGDPEITIFGPPPGMRRRVFDWRPADELIGIELLCGEISLEGEGGVIFLFEVGAYITWWISFVPKPGRRLIANSFNPTGRQLIANSFNPNPSRKLIEPESVIETHKVYLSMPTMVKVPGSDILLSRWLPTWLRMAHYIERIVNGFRKIDEVEKTLGKISLLKAGICLENIDRFKLALQKIEDEANEILQRSGGDDELAWSMRGKPPFYAQLAGSRMRIG